MAQEWCVAYGVLSYEEAERVNEIVKERKGLGKAKAIRKDSNSKKQSKK